MRVPVSSVRRTLLKRNSNTLASTIIKIVNDTKTSIKLKPVCGSRGDECLGKVLIFILPECFDVVVEYDLFHACEA